MTAGADIDKARELSNGDQNLNINNNGFGQN